MNLNEFKSWLDGFSEAIDNAPTKEQWEKIKVKLQSVHEITLAPMPNIPNMTPSTWPLISPIPLVSPNPWDKYPIICSGSGSAGDPPNSGCTGITNGEAKGILPCH